MDNSREALGLRLKKIRTIKCVSVYKLSLNTKLSRQQINGIEAGDTSYTIDSFLKYIEGIGVKLFFEDNTNEACHL